MFNISEIGNRIKKERESIGYSLQELGDEINVSRQTLSLWEKGKGNGPTVFDLARMCEIFQCDLGYLVGEYECRTKEATDICKVTGLSEESALDLLELSSMDEKIKMAVLSVLDSLLDWKLLPSLAVRFQQFLIGEYDGKSLHVVDDLGKYVALLPEDAAFILLQNEITNFLTHAKAGQSDGLSRREERKEIRRRTKEEQIDIQSDKALDIRRGK